MHDLEGDTASHLIFMLPSPEAAVSFRRAAGETGTGFSIISENTWHYAKHWKALEEMGKRISSAPRLPLMPPKQWQRQKPNSAGR